MLQILLTILKVLGILILVILGMILAILLIVLFVPLRYRGDISFDEKPKGGIFLSWFLRFVTVRVDYDGSVLKALVKVLWFKLVEQTLWPAEDVTEQDAELTQDAKSLEAELADDGFFDVPVQKPDVKPEKTVPESQKKEPEIQVQSVSHRAEPVQRASADKTAVSEKAAPKNAKQKTEQNAKQKAEQKTEQNAEQNTNNKESAVSKSSVIETIFKKIQGTVEKMVSKVRNIYSGLSSKYTAGQDKINTIRTFLGDAENQNTIRLLWRQVLKLLKHIFPRKLNGRVRFGFDDPATTGQILTYISPFYGMYAKTLTIEPVFDEKVIEGEVHVKGHIRVASLLWIVIRVVLNKNFRMLLKNFLKKSK